MILTDDEIKVDEYGYWIGDDFDAQILAESHLEANERIRELEAALEDRCADRLAVVADALAVECQEIADGSVVANVYERAMGELRNTLEDRLRGLVEATEWRDECLSAKNYCFYRRDDYADRSDRWQRWDRSLGIAIDYLDNAQDDYDAALAAAKGELCLTKGD